MSTLNEFLSEHQIELTTLAIVLPFGFALIYWLRREKAEAAEDQLPLVPDGTYVLRASRAKHFFYFTCEIVPAAILLYVTILGFCDTFARLTDGIVDTESVIIDAILTIAAGCASAYLFYRIFARFKRLSDQIIVSAEGIVASRWRPFRRVTTSYAWADIRSAQIDVKYRHFLAHTYQVPTLHIVTAQQEIATSQQEIVTSQQEECIPLLCFLLDRHFYDAINYYHAVATAGPDADVSEQQQLVTYQKAWWNTTY